MNIFLNETNPDGLIPHWNQSVDVPLVFINLDDSVLIICSTPYQLILGLLMEELDSLVNFCLQS